MSAQKTFNETLDSLTGYEELAITQHFGADITTLLETNATFAGRALIFTERTRSGEAPKDAKKHAMSLTLKSVNDYFKDDEPEVDEDDPITASGKGAGSPA